MGDEKVRGALATVREAPTGDGRFVPEARDPLPRALAARGRRRAPRVPAGSAARDPTAAAGSLRSPPAGGGPPRAAITDAGRGSSHMTGTAARYLYLARHGEATPDETELTEAGRRQAALLGERLRGVPLDAIHHGPLPRAAQTAALVAGELDGVPLAEREAAGDYLPYVPDEDELPPDCSEFLMRFVRRFPAGERETGPALAREATRLFTGPVAADEPRHELVVTHNFLIGWLVRASQDAPPWRWLGLVHCNAALTVIRYVPGRPSSLLLYNDMGHLPDELRWTGFPPESRI